MLIDFQDYNNEKAALDRGVEELFPSELVDALFEGRYRIKVWREHRGLSQQEAAGAPGTSDPYLSQLESGKREGSVEVMAVLTRALNLSLDLLIGPN